MSATTNRDEHPRKNLKRRIEKRLMKFIMPHFRRMFSQIANASEAFDQRRPAVALAKVQELFQQWQKMTQVPVQPLPPNQARNLNRIVRLLRRYPIQQELRQFARQLLRLTKREAMRDARASLLLKLISEADQTVPLMPMLVLQEAAHPIQRLRPQLAGRSLNVTGVNKRRNESPSSYASVPRNGGMALRTLSSNLMVARELCVE